MSPKAIVTERRRVKHTTSSAAIPRPTWIPSDLSEALCMCRVIIGRAGSLNDQHALTRSSGAWLASVHPASLAMSVAPRSEAAQRDRSRSRSAL